MSYDRFSQQGDQGLRADTKADAEPPRRHRAFFKAMRSYGIDLYLDQEGGAAAFLPRRFLRRGEDAADINWPLLVEAVDFNDKHQNVIVRPVLEESALSQPGRTNAFASSDTEFSLLRAAKGDDRAAPAFRSPGDEACPPYTPSPELAARLAAADNRLPRNPTMWQLLKHLMRTLFSRS